MGPQGSLPFSALAWAGSLPKSPPAHSVQQPWSVASQPGEVFFSSLRTSRFQPLESSASSLLSPWTDGKELGNSSAGQHRCLKSFLFHINTSMNSEFDQLFATQFDINQTSTLWQPTGVRKEHLKTPWTLPGDGLPIPIFDLYYKAVPIKYCRDLWANFHSSCFTPKITWVVGPVGRKFRFRFQLFRFPFTFKT